MSLYNCLFRLIIGVWLILPGSATGAEVDSVTAQKVDLEDSQADIDHIFQQRIEEGVARANGRAGDVEDMEADDYCDQELLYLELRKAIFQSFTASWGLKGYQLDMELRELVGGKGYSINLEDSIYRDINYIEGFSLKLKELSDLVNIGGHLIGLDKIGHMFAEGYHYFDQVNNDGVSLQKAMSWGREQEEGKFGYMTTGIFSYSDLVANFHGYRFWNRVEKKQADPLLSFWENWLTTPYVSCSVQLLDSLKYRKIVRAWEVGDRFTLGDYVDGSWDETNNCISYSDPEIESKVTARVKMVDPQFSCPASTQECVKAKKRYGRLAKDLLHPLCLRAGG